MRRLAKRLIHPLASERTYRWVQCLAKAWDIRTGSWTEPELDLVRSAVREGDTVLDVGANFGLYSYHLSRAVGSTGRVIAFEPVPSTFATLVDVAKLLRFRNVELVPKGCSDVSGRVTFTVPVQTSGAVSAGIAHISGRNDDRPLTEGHVRWEHTAKVEAEVVALDSFLPSLESLSLFKCDIEGAELLAFRGARRLIEHHKPTIVCEIDQWYLDGFGISVNDLAGFFLSQGYGLYAYRAVPERRLTRIDVAEIGKQNNYIFLHPRYLERLISFVRGS